MVKSPLTVDARRRLYEGDSRWPAKAILRILATLFAFLTLILLAISVSYTNKNFVNSDGPGDWTDGFALAPVLISLFYNPIALILLIIVRRGQHFHPVWHVAIDFIIWGLSIPAIIFTVGGGIFWYWAPAILDRNGDVECSFFFNEFSPECDPIAYTIGKLEIAGIVFLFFIFVMHFVLFVFACIDTHKWRKARKMARAEKENFELQYNQSSNQEDSREPPAYAHSDVTSINDGPTKFV